VDAVDALAVVDVPMPQEDGEHAPRRLQHGPQGTGVADGVVAFPVHAVLHENQRAVSGTL